MVYRAWDPQLRRHVALEFLSRDRPSLAQRFIGEAQAQARVEHPHVCKVFEVGDADGRPYIAMQCIDGLSLRDAAAEMSLDDKVHTMRKVAEAVHEAHGQGRIHRDLEPANVMVERTEAGRWFPDVLDFDFGIACELAPAEARHEVAGTPRYMAETTTSIVHEAVTLEQAGGARPSGSPTTSRRSSSSASSARRSEGIRPRRRSPMIFGASSRASRSRRGHRACSIWSASGCARRGRSRS